MSLVSSAAHLGLARIRMRTGAAAAAQAARALELASLIDALAIEFI